MGGLCVTGVKEWDILQGNALASLRGETMGLSVTSVTEWDISQESVQMDLVMTVGEGIEIMGVVEGPSVTSAIGSVILPVSVTKKRTAVTSAMEQVTSRGTAVRMKRPATIVTRLATS